MLHKTVGSWADNLKKQMHTPATKESLTKTSINMAKKYPSKAHALAKAKK